MIKLVVIEQKDVARNSSETAFKRKPKNCDTIYHGEFIGKNEFEKILLEGMSEFFKCCDTDIKLLIISAHGIELTSTQLDAGTGNFEPIDWYNLSQYFEVVPDNLTIFFNVCFGLYPSSWQLQKTKANKPILIGPLVDIKIKLVNQIQNDLIKHLLTNGNNESNTLKLIDKYNTSGYASAYANRVVLGCLKSNGTIYPDNWAGQLCAEVRGAHVFTILELSGNPIIVNCLLERNGKKYTANASRLHDIASDPVQLRDRQIKIKYQIYKEYEDNNIGRLEINNRPQLLK
jgi:hypothetical protein